MEKIRYRTQTPSVIPEIWKELSEDPCASQSGDFIKEFRTYCLIHHVYVRTQIRYLKNFTATNLVDGLEQLVILSDSLMWFTDQIQESFFSESLAAPLRRMLLRIYRRNTAVNQYINDIYDLVADDMSALFNDVVDEEVAYPLKNFRIVRSKPLA